MRHSRSAEFTRALESFRPGTTGQRRWVDDAPDPNDPAALVRRAEVLRAAWRPEISDRIAYLEQRCSGKRVLDIGCVAHDVARMKSPLWLHGRLAAVASECLGVDVLAEGVEAMCRLGFDGVAHDLGTGLGPIAERAPFDVVVAGELIEHVESVDMLFRTARDALVPGGELILTTPNPYAPDRVRAHQLGLVYENVDHILFAFPSGIAELAERHGLVLSEAAVTRRQRPTGVVARLKAVRRRLRGRQWAAVGYTTWGERRIRRVSFGPVGGVLRGMWRPGQRLTGETFVYVITQPEASGASTDA